MHFPPRLPHSDSFSHLAQQVRNVLTHRKHEKESEAHQVLIALHLAIQDNLILVQIFRQAAGHSVKGVFPQTVNPVCPFL